MMKQSRLHENTLIAVVLFIIAYFSLLYRLDANALFIWDEARVAVSALEMAQSGNWFIPTYNYEPDMWSVKPPLLVIFQAISMKAVGYNELGARLPTAIASILTVCMLFWFATKVMNSRLAGFTAVLLLCTSGGYISFHVARSADYDTLLIFFLTSYFICAFLFLEERKYRYYLLFCLSVLLALFTKGIAGAFFLPGVFLLFITDKNFRKEIFHVKHLLPVLAVLSAIVSYYIIREQYNPGYIHTVFFEEMQGRMFNSKFDTGTSTNSFLIALINSDFNPWWILIPLAIPVYFKCSKEEKKLMRFIAITLFIFWIPLTISINKNSWYSAPTFPLLALLGALVFSKILTHFSDTIQNLHGKKALIVIVLTLASTGPLYQTYLKTGSLRNDFGLAELVKNNRIQTGTKFISQGYNSPLDFYQKALQLKNVSVERTTIENVKQGDRVVVLSKNESDHLRQRFTCDVIYSHSEVEMLLIK